MRFLLIFLVALTGHANANFEKWFAEYSASQTLSEASLSGIRDLANDGDLPAMLLMAELADQGIGTPNERPQADWAFGWFLKSAREGSLVAATELSKRYFLNRGIPEQDELTQDQRQQRAIARGIFWLNRAANEYHPPALMMLAGLYATGMYQDRAVLQPNQVNLDNSRDLLELAAAADHAPAYLALYQLDHQAEASRFDPVERRARVYLERCVNLKYAPCQYEQATLLFTGDEQSRDVGRGAALLAAAAAQGLVKAEILLLAVRQLQTGSQSPE